MIASWILSLFFKPALLGSLVRESTVHRPAEKFMTGLPKGDARVLFVGHFNPRSGSQAAGVSAAGDQVQRAIAGALAKVSEACEVVALASAPSWPRGPLTLPSEREGNVWFVPAVNVFGLRNICLSIAIVMRLWRYRPNVAIIYNPYAAEAISLLIAKFFAHKLRLGALVQDVNPPRGSWGSIGVLGNMLGDTVAMRAFCRYDVVVPVSDQIISDFNLPRSRSKIFAGGLTAFALRQIGATRVPLQDIVVYAGALEKHNGVDLLVRRWVEDQITVPLHIFGRGTLEPLVSEAASESRYIHAHGHVAEDVVFDWQRCARWHLCLRYSRGLDQRYFFPSKFFNVLSTRGHVIVNDSFSCPPELGRFALRVADDLSLIGRLLREASEASDSIASDARIAFLTTNYSWDACARVLVGGD
jgi:hypothetical protein